MADPKISPTREAADLSDALVAPVSDAEDTDATEVTGKVAPVQQVPLRAAAKALSSAGLGLRRFPMARRAGRGRKNRLSEAVIDEVDASRAKVEVAREGTKRAAGITGDHATQPDNDLPAEVAVPPARMLVAPPAHAPARDAAPTWTFGAAPPVGGPRPPGPGAVIAGRIERDVRIPEPPGSPGDVASNETAGQRADAPSRAAAPAGTTAMRSAGASASTGGAFDLSGNSADVPALSTTPGDSAATALAVPALGGSHAGAAPALKRSSFGPAGKRRNPATVIALTIVTLGVYGLAWYARINREMGDFDARMPVYSRRSTWAVVPPWVAGLAASAVGVTELIAANVTHTGLPVMIETPYAVGLACGVLMIPYLTLLMPFSLVGTVMTVERVRVVEEHIGMTTDVQIRPPKVVARLLIPIIGGLSVMRQQQLRLNDVWERVSPGGGLHSTRRG